MIIEKLLKASNIIVIEFEILRRKEFLYLL